MLFSVSLFDINTYVIVPDSNTFGLNLIASYDPNSEGFIESFNTYIEAMAVSKTPILLVSALNNSWQSIDVIYYICVNNNIIAKYFEKLRTDNYIN